MAAYKFIEATLRRFARTMSHALVSEQLARRRGLLQALDPRVRLVGIFALILAVTMTRKLLVAAFAFLIASCLSLMSGLSVRSLAGRVWLVAFGFAGLIAVPAVFVIPGAAAFRVGPLVATEPGIRSAALLILRVETTVTLSTALALCTPWTHMLKALRSIAVPAEVVAMLAMAHRYIFLLIETANEMFESRQSRVLGTLSGEEQRRMAARTAGVLLNKSIDLSQEVYLAMQSRGFRGDIQLITDRRLKPADYAGLASFLLVAGGTVWLGR